MPLGRAGNGASLGPAGSLCLTAQLGAGQCHVAPSQDLAMLLLFARVLWTQGSKGSA